MSELTKWQSEVLRHVFLKKVVRNSEPRVSLSKAYWDALKRYKQAILNGEHGKQDDDPWKNFTKRIERWRKAVEGEEAVLAEWHSGFVIAGVAATLDEESKLALALAPANTPASYHKTFKKFLAEFLTQETVALLERSCSPKNPTSKIDGVFVSIADQLISSQGAAAGHPPTNEVHGSEYTKSTDADIDDPKQPSIEIAWNSERASSVAPPPIGAAFLSTLDSIGKALDDGPVYLHGAGGSGKTTLARWIVDQAHGHGDLIDLEVFATTRADLFIALGYNGVVLGELVGLIVKSDRLIVFDQFERVIDPVMREIVFMLVAQLKRRVLLVGQNGPEQRIEARLACFACPMLVNWKEVREVEDRYRFSGDPRWVDAELQHIYEFASGHVGTVVALCILSNMLPGQSSAQLMSDAWEEVSVDGKTHSERLMARLLRELKPKERALLHEIATLPEAWDLDALMLLPAFDKSVLIALVQKRHIRLEGGRYAFDLNPLKEVFRKSPSGDPERDKLLKRVVFTYYASKVRNNPNRAEHYLAWMKRFSIETDQDRVNDAEDLVRDELNLPSASDEQPTTVANLAMSSSGSAANELDNVFSKLSDKDKESALYDIGRNLKFQRKIAELRHAQGLLNSFSQGQSLELELVRLENSYRLYRLTYAETHRNAIYERLRSLESSKQHKVAMLSARVRIGLLFLPTLDPLRRNETLEHDLIARSRKGTSVERFEAGLRLLWYYEKLTHNSVSTHSTTAARRLVQSATQLCGSSQTGWEEDVFLTLVRTAQIGQALAFANQRSDRFRKRSPDMTAMLDRVADVRAMELGHESDFNWVSSNWLSDRSKNLLKLLRSMPKLSRPAQHWVVDRLWKIAAHHQLTDLIGGFNMNLWCIDSMSVCEKTAVAWLRTGVRVQAAMFALRALKVSHLRGDEARRVRLVELMLNHSLFNECTQGDISQVANILTIYTSRGRFACELDDRIKGVLRRRQ